MILINRTYETVTHESAEHGEAAERGFICENMPYGFRDLVDTLKCMSNTSCWPATGATHEWCTGEPDTDYRTGEYTTESIHFSRENKPRAAKYWSKAFAAAGLINRRI